jgi:hypothetical protein
MRQAYQMCVPQPGEIVSITLRNGLIIKGKVLHWSDNKSAIQMASSIKILQKTVDDVLFVDIIESEKKHEQIKSKPIKNDDDIRELAELKIELLKLEREELASKLQNHELTEIKPVQYGLPTPFQIKNTIKYPREKTSREDTGFGAALQNVFRKEHSKD